MVLELLSAQTDKRLLKIYLEEMDQMRSVWIDDEVRIRDGRCQCKFDDEHEKRGDKDRRKRERKGDKRIR